jgi:glycerophosphoryl diester phosphodiesterase
MLWLTEIKQTGSGVWRPTAQQIVATANQIGADGVDLEARPEALDEAFFSHLRAAGLEIHVWTVNDEKLARRMIDLGVDGITTDRPDWLSRFK